MNTKNKLAEHKKDVASLFFVLKKDCKRAFQKEAPTTIERAKSPKKGPLLGEKGLAPQNKRPATKSK